jgi:hypothetical protein
VPTSCCAGTRPPRRAISTAGSAAGSSTSRHDHALRRKLDAYEKLIRLDKPIGILLLLWPTLWALWLAARGVPNLLALWLFVLGTVLMRSAGCAINDYADRSFDAHVERTRARPLAAGLIRPWEALAVAAVARARRLRVVLQFNTLTCMLSVPAVAHRGDLSLHQALLLACRRRGWAWPSASASRWRSRALTGACRRSRGTLLAANVFWTSPTTPSTPWSTATTT